MHTQINRSRWHTTLMRLEVALGGKPLSSGFKSKPHVVSVNQQATHITEPFTLSKCSVERRFPVVPKWPLLCPIQLIGNKIANSASSIFTSEFDIASFPISQFAAGFSRIEDG